MTNSPLQVRFWGVRGSVPTPSKENLGYGGNTTCLEVRTRRWGHSTWLEATRIAEACNVKRLVLFHHDPSHNDKTVDRIVQEARRYFSNTEAAREGYTMCA
jgi:phosphoribosyl 1,2-cyclic phosphodiesterase